MNESLENEKSAADTIRRMVAQQQLGVLERCEGLSGHQLACQRIRSLRFSPPGNLHSAILTLAEASPGAESEPVDDPDFCEQVLRLELRKFRSEFYSIAPTERKDIWNQLNACVEKFPQLKWQLGWLESGLAVIRPPDEDDTRVATLARNICDILVMSPAASVAALHQLCETALTKDNGVAIGDDYLEMSRVMPEIGDLRPAMNLPNTMHHIRTQPKNRRERTSDYSPQSLGTTQKEQGGIRTVYRILLCTTLLVVGGAFLAGVISGRVVGERPTGDRLSYAERYGLPALKTKSNSTSSPQSTPTEPAENPKAEDSAPDHATAEKSWDYQVLPSGRIEAKETGKEWPRDDTAKKSSKPLSLSEIKELMRRAAKEAEGKAGKK